MITTVHGKQRTTVLAATVLLAAIAALLIARPWATPPSIAPTADVADAAATPAAGDTSSESPATTPARAELDADPSPPTKAEPAPTELWGRVIAANTNAAVAGAEVRLQQRDADEFWNLDLAYGEQIDELGRTTSGQDGRFRFAVARGREHRLQVRAAGFAPTTVLDCSGGSEVVVALTAGATVEGVVRCEDATVAEATVRIAVAGQSLTLTQGRTDSHGRFRFESLQPESVYVQVSSERHDEVWQRLELTSGQTHRIEIELLPGRTLTGRVIDATSRAPIAQAAIATSWTFNRAVRSDADGRFTLGGASDSTVVEVYVRADGYASATRTLTSLAEPVELELLRGGDVTGRFVDADGTPLSALYAAAGASFMIRNAHQHTDWIRAEVAANGLFRVAGLHPGQHYWLYVRSRTHGARIYALPRALVSGERIDVGDIVLRQAGGLEGRIIDDRGDPIADRRVSVSGHNDDAEAWLEPGQQPQRVSQFESRDLNTDDGGAFRVTGLATGTYTVSIDSQQRSIKRAVVVNDGAITSGVELVVPVGGSIEGTLRYADGRPLGDEAAQVWLAAARKNGRSAQGKVEAGGRFRFTELEEGSYTIALPRGPAGWALSPKREVETGTQDLHLILEAAATLGGRVVDADGKGFRAHLWAQSKDLTGIGSPIHYSDDDGNFRIEVPSDFVGTVGAMHPENPMLQAKQDDVAAGRTDLRLQLALPAGLEQRLRKR